MSKKSGIIEGEGKMDTNISALMARIREIQSRIREIQGMTARGPESAVPPAAPSVSDGTEAADAAASGTEFSAILEEALGLLGQDGTTGAAGTGDLMSSALNGLSSLTDLERVLRGTLDDSTYEE
jgi:hypothetical protein